MIPTSADGSGHNQAYVNTVEPILHTRGIYPAEPAVYPSSATGYPNQTNVSHLQPGTNNIPVARYNASEEQCNIPSAPPPNYYEATNKSQNPEYPEKERF